MGKELTVIAIAAVFIFGWWYFSRQGCKGEANGTTGAEGSLCYTGPSVIPGMDEEEDAGAPPPTEDMVAPEAAPTPSSSLTPLADRATPNCDEATKRCKCPGRPTFQMGASRSCSDCTYECNKMGAGGIGSGVYKGATSRLAHAYAGYVNNAITIA